MQQSKALPAVKTSSENITCINRLTKESALMTTTSAEDGSFSFESIPYGTWYVREIEQPAGFVLDDTIYPVTIGADGQVVEIEIVNAYVRGNIHLTKVDAPYIFSWWTTVIIAQKTGKCLSKIAIVFCRNM